MAGTQVELDPGDIVLDGDPVPTKSDTVLNFRPVSIVAKRSTILATAGLFFSIMFSVLLTFEDTNSIENLGAYQQQFTISAN